MKNLKTERRRFPRIDKSLPLKVAANGYDFITYTHNLSCVGTYCRVSKYIPPFTKISIKLSLPINSGNKEHRVECNGVVVRTDDEKEGGFNIAVFFNQIRDTQKEKLSEYINQFATREPAKPVAVTKGQWAR